MQNQVAFKSYPVEPIGPLACTSDGAYLAGGGASGRIYFWEVRAYKCVILNEGLCCVCRNLFVKGGYVDYHLLFFGVLGGDWAVAKALARPLQERELPRFL